MNSFRLNIKLGHILYVLVLLMACVLRFLRLGELPLTNPEATAALQAAQLTPSASALFSEADQAVPQPAYEILTRALFQIFGAGELVARAIPALAGALLVLTPLLARKKIGFGHSLLMGLLLAISPIFVTVSRTASGISLSALGVSVFLMALIGKEDENQASLYILSGAGLGLALSSGPYIYPAFISLGFGLLWFFVRSKNKYGENRFPFSFNQLRPLLFSTAITSFFLVTGIGWSIQGLSRFFDSIAYWIQGWSGASSYSGITLLIIILAYTPVLVVAGLLGVWSSLRERDAFGGYATAIVFIGLIVGLFYPSRQPHDLLWVALPLAFLASKYLLSFIHHVVELRVTAWVIALSLILILLSFMAYIQISATASQDLPIDIFDAWQTPFVFLTLMFVIVAFFGLGWGWDSAKLSVIVALLCITFILSVSAVWRLNLSSQMFTAKELWRREVPTRGLKLLVKTIDSTSHSIKGVEEGLRVEIIGEAPSALIWALREYNPHPESESGEIVASPVILVKGDHAELTLQSDYVGQTIAIGEHWGWESLLPPDMFKWWVERDPPVISEEWLVLIRQDIAFLLEQ